MFSPQDRWVVLSDIDALLMATQDAEPFGRVVQEAAAAGAPTIGPAVGGIAEQIRDGLDGLLYRFRDQAHLESQMARLLTEADLYQRLTTNLWHVVDTREAVRAVEAFYFQVLQTREVEASGRSPQAVISRG
jgi:glycosyltransferase involved in cell wall biosynthesis